MNAPQTACYDRHRKFDVPFGWTPWKIRDKNGKDVQIWRCSYVHKNFFTNKYERCSVILRKDRITDHFHEFKIKDEDQQLLMKVL